MWRKELRKKKEEQLCLVDDFLWEIMETERVVTEYIKNKGADMECWIDKFCGDDDNYFGEESSGAVDIVLLSDYGFSFDLSYKVYLYCELSFWYDGEQGERKHFEEIFDTLEEALDFVVDWYKNEIKKQMVF